MRSIFRPKGDLEDSVFSTDRETLRTRRAVRAGLSDRPVSPRLRHGEELAPQRLYDFKPGHVQ